MVLACGVGGAHTTHARHQQLQAHPELALQALDGLEVRGVGHRQHQQPPLLLPGAQTLPLNFRLRLPRAVGTNLGQLLLDKHQELISY